jgi:probable H4MPT-linked C1 transfer pathway protein
VTGAILGLDVGGANLKAALDDGTSPPAALSVPFPLWQRPAELPEQLRVLVARPGSRVDRLAVTMTGELCDCYESKRQGVAAILAAVQSAAGGRPVRVWSNDGRLVSLEEARARPLQVAAANWLALATFAGRQAGPGPALLLDVGSTTTDVVPLLDGRPVPRGRTDPQRLRCGELVYVGVRRTPLCALLGGEVAAELFATALDAYLVLGHIAEDRSERGTADGRPAALPEAHARLARMLCADLETSTEEERRRLAEQALARQVEQIDRAIGRVCEHLPGSPRVVLLAGEGAFLAEHVLRRAAGLSRCRIVNLAETLGEAVSRAACAWAVARLAAEEERAGR